MQACKKVFMIAFHYPPMSGSSGYLRPLRFAQFLKEDHGWQPIILTANPRVYPRLDPDQKHQLEGVTVYRAFALDAQKDLAIKGRYLELTACPDAWASWYLPALVKGIKAIRHHRPDVIWSTCPIPTANLVAATLSRCFEIPWVADFRDPMTLEDYPVNPTKRRSARLVERITMRHAEQICFTSDYTRLEYCDRYPGIEHKTNVVPNGYDELVAENTTSGDKGYSARSEEDIILLHAGALFPDGRHPKNLLSALRNMLDNNVPLAHRLRIRLRASGHEASYQSDIDRLDLNSCVQLLEATSYSSVRKEMKQASGLLLLQGSAFDHSIPAKLYEYLVSDRPILGLIGEYGATANELQALNIPYIANMEDVSSIMRMLSSFLEHFRAAKSYVVPKNVVATMSRRKQTEKLVVLLEKAKFAASKQF